MGVYSGTIRDRLSESREAEIRREARKRTLDEFMALSSGEQIECGIGVDVERAYYLILARNERNLNAKEIHRGSL